MYIIRHILDETGYVYSLQDMYTAVNLTTIYEIGCIMCMLFRKIMGMDRVDYRTRDNLVTEWRVSLYFHVSCLCYLAVRGVKLKNEVLNLHFTTSHWSRSF